jgi:hypothetical protein
MPVVYVVTDNADGRHCARTIAVWKPSAAAGKAVDAPTARKLKPSGQD